MSDMTPKVETRVHFCDILFDEVVGCRNGVLAVRRHGVGTLLLENVGGEWQVEEIALDPSANTPEDTLYREFSGRWTRRSDWAELQESEAYRTVRAAALRPEAYEIHVVDHRPGDWVWGVTTPCGGYASGSADTYKKALADADECVRREIYWAELEDLC